MSIRSFRDLRVWHLGMDAVVEVYALSKAFPDYERFGLASQVQRAAVSIPANIAEGHSRLHIREYLHHVSFALASLSEVETHLEIAVRLGYITAERCQKVADSLDALGRQLRALSTSLVAKAVE